MLHLKRNLKHYKVRKKNRKYTFVQRYHIYHHLGRYICTY